MSTKKERKEEVTTTASSSATTSFSPSELQQEQYQAVSKTLDRTKENLRISTEEARSQIPRYAQAVGEYHEQTIQASREIADNYLESQKEIINSLQSAWAPHVEKTTDMLYAYCISPRKVVGYYTRAVSSFADNTIAATRLLNNAMVANLEAFKTSVQNAKENLKEISRITANSAKTFEAISRDTAAAHQ